MHFLVFGGTGQAGSAFNEEALRAGHQLTLYARSPGKIPQDVKNNPSVTTVEGDFNTWDAVHDALSKGAETLVSFLGPALPFTKGMDFTNFYEKLFALLPDHSSIKRCFVLSTASYKVSEDRFSLKWFFGVLLIQVIGGTAYKEINGMSRATAAIPLDRVEWTIFRVPGLTNGEAKPVRASMIGEGGDGLLLSRKSIAVWILQELEQRKWVGKAPAISNIGWI